MVILFELVKCELDRIHCSNAVIFAFSTKINCLAGEIEKGNALTKLT